MLNKLINLLNSKDDSQVEHAHHVSDGLHYQAAPKVPTEPPEIPCDADPQKLFEYAYYWEFYSPDVDLERAAYYYQKAALLGHPEAMYRLGKYYESGTRTVGINRPHAHYWYCEAIKYGHQKARVAHKVLELRRAKGHRA